MRFVFGISPFSSSPLVTLIFFYFAVKLPLVSPAPFYACCIAVDDPSVLFLRGEMPIIAQLSCCNFFSLGGGRAIGGNEAFMSHWASQKLSKLDGEEMHKK